MILSQVAGGGAIPLLEKTLAFAEARNRVLAENIANLTTPGYRMKSLDPRAFQSALAEASARREREDGSFELRPGRQWDTDQNGFLRAKPTTAAGENLLFQDGTSARIESFMAQLGENAMLNQVAAELLNGYYQGLNKAIRGRVA
jgi:flagellar basal-body rod protein FlgB